MNRRAFLSWLGGTAAGVALAPTLDLDKLLWIPGEKTIFLPSPRPPLMFHEDAFAFVMQDLPMIPSRGTLGLNTELLWKYGVDRATECYRASLDGHIASGTVRVYGVPK